MLEPEVQSVSGEGQSDSGKAHSDPEVGQNPVKNPEPRNGGDADELLQTEEALAQLAIKPTSEVEKFEIQVGGIRRKQTYQKQLDVEGSLPLRSIFGGRKPVPTLSKPTVEEILNFKEKVSSNKDIIYVGKEALSADTCKPSETKITEGFRQIRVYKNQEAMLREELLDQNEGEMEEKIKAEFEDLYRSENFDSANDLMSIAQKNKFTTGKWLITIPWSLTDECWKILIDALINDKLTAEVRYIKVWAREDGDSNPHNKYSKGRITANAMISIMTWDWTNKEATMEVAKKAFDAGVEGTLRYKPDICSTLGIYRNNTMKIKPTVYTLVKTDNGVLDQSGVLDHCSDWKPKVDNQRSSSSFSGRGGRAWRGAGSGDRMQSRPWRREPGVHGSDSLHWRSDPKP